MKIKWFPQPEDHNYQAAISYLSLIAYPDDAKKIADTLKAYKIVWFKAKDIFRASGLSLLGVSNSHVKKDRKKIKSGKRLSPILLVRNEHGAKVIIADGYHRLCAVYSFDEDALIPCKIA